jgi:uncharacterized membrane protein
MNYGKFFYGALALAILSVGVGYYFYPSLPATIPTHWNIAGEADSFSTKEAGLSIMPILSVCMMILFAWLPKADPKKENVKFNQPYYEITIFCIMLFLFALYCVTIAIPLGYNIDVGKFMVISMGIMFIVLGKQMEFIKSNWFFGIRTPWTISNDAIWTKTHRIGARLFNAFGIVLLIFGFIMPSLAIPILIAFSVALAVWSIVYPYMEWKKIH